ncbi:MAG: 23S rRNA (adenine(2503)-C(2))-methyltransferase RlmN [Verrucomicrobia bacterium]|jgi:23S rRNA (adenine2503-C2)-methyltransferase|nr:23S rRNA (adenine(2503)-C(2))-methyltransferase RlmN [Verrucomicrobiota bacterium]MBT7068068.1 23S rRNA (adenine(2503)-C(2))-methyltransferase RlmN [Verrucomicrobiota bacterium]
MISVYDQASLEALRKRTGIQPFDLKRFRNALYKKAFEKESALAVLPEAARAAFSQSLCFEPLKLSERHDSAVDGATKLGFHTHDGLLIESVILRVKSGRTALCVSSQVGCACKCGFCATGALGFIRNLTRDEMLDQVAQANRLLQKEECTVRNIVFMGMGEPLLNTEPLFQALELLSAPAGFDYSQSRLMVSTVGIPAGMLSCAEQFPNVQQALSLHSARQAVRERLLPIAHQYSLEALQDTIRTVGANGDVMIEYLMLEGINDGEQDYAALCRYLQGLPVHINIIPYNAFEGSSWHGTPQCARVAFANRLKSAGFKVTQRYSLGLDIAAACGQLAGEHLNDIKREKGE